MSELAKWVDAVIEVADCEGMKDSVVIPTWPDEGYPPLTVGAVREVARLTLALTAQGERLKTACRLLMEMKGESLCQPPFDFALTTKVDEFLSEDAAAQDQRGGGA